jgi:AcrR family transcriptional regulator
MPVSEPLLARAGIAPAAPPHASGDRMAADLVREAQRTRILAAMVRIACDHGVHSASVAQVSALAGISRQTFHRVFEDREECLLAAIEHAVACAHVRARAAFEIRDSWVAAVRAGLFALLAFFEQEPGLARLCVVHPPAAGSAALARRGEVLDQLARVIDEGRDARGAAREPPPLTAEGLVGGTLAVIHTRLVRADPQPLTELLNPLMSMIVLPYLGGAAARRELSRPLPSTPPSTPATHGSPPDLLEGLDLRDMRLTYRTLRVLAVIALQPGLSNRQVGERAGISDQGQICKLLGRLARLELIENTGIGYTAGAANAWRLTPRGNKLERRFRPAAAHAA